MAIKRRVWRPATCYSISLGAASRGFCSATALSCIHSPSLQSPGAPLRQPRKHHTVHPCKPDNYRVTHQARPAKAPQAATLRRVHRLPCWRQAWHSRQDTDAHVGEADNLIRVHSGMQLCIARLADLQINEWSQGGQGSRSDACRRLSWPMACMTPPAHLRLPHDAPLADRRGRLPGRRQYPQTTEMGQTSQNTSSPRFVWRRMSASRRSRNQGEMLSDLLQRAGAAGRPVRASTGSARHRQPLHVRA